MCPQQAYYKAFISHRNWFSPPQEFSTKIPQFQPVVVLIGSKSEQPDRFKTQTNDPSKLLGCNSNTLQDLVKQKKSLCIIVLLSKYFLNTFVKITILGELYQYSSCCTKLEQHWTKCLYVHSSPIVQHDGEQLFLFS